MNNRPTKKSIYNDTICWWRLVWEYWCMHINWIVSQNDILLYVLSPKGYLYYINSHKSSQAKLLQKSYHKDESGLIWVRNIIRRLKCKQKISTLAHNTRKGPSFRFSMVVFLWSYQINKSSSSSDTYIKNSLNWQSSFHFSSYVIV